MAAEAVPPHPVDPELALERELHARLLAGERWATDDLTTYFLPRLQRRLEGEFPPLRSDPDLTGCILEALQEYYLAPERYRPELGSLRGYLHLAAKRDALNLLRRRGPAGRQVELVEEKVAAEPERWNELLRRVEDDLPGLPEGISFSEVEARVKGSLRDAGDRRILRLILEADAGFDNCVAALNLQGRPRAEQERLVKQAKDRGHAALRRVRKQYEHG